MYLSRFQDSDEEERRAATITDTRSLVRNFRRAAGRSQNEEERALLAVQDPPDHTPAFDNE
eukprot:10482992-Alexandrium_andersonii.AAC.1